MHFSSEEHVATDAESRLQRVARTAGKVGASLLVAYGAFTTLDAAVHLAETVAEPLNLSTELSVEPIHHAFDAATPDFVVKPIAERLNPDWAPITEAGAGLVTIATGIGGFLTTLPRVDKQA